MTCANCDHTATADCDYNETQHPATCVKGAYTTYECKLCGYSFDGEATAADPANHVHTEDVAETDPTCTEHGYTAGVYCNDCEQFISGHEEKDLAAHTLRHVDAKAPTCSAYGNIEYYVCEVCGRIFADAEATDELTASGTVIAATLEHSLEHVPAKAATATADGNIEYWYCAQCGKYFADAAATRQIDRSKTVIPATDKDSGDCPYCGKNHNDKMYGWIIHLLHIIAYYFLILVNIFK